VLLAALSVAGCGEDEKVAPSVSEPPALEVIHPELRDIVRYVGQPSFVESFERTSIYPKMTAFIEKWNVDIGDNVKKGDVLADLFVPELREDFGTKQATVQYDVERVRVALKVVEVAAAEVTAAKARLEEAESILGKYEAEVKRWDVEVKRLAGEVEHGVIAPQILLESQNQLDSDIAARDAAIAAIRKAKAELEADEARLARANVDVAAARAELAVARSEARRLEALVGYLKLFAPFDGIVVGRNANTWDFVLPQFGDPTAYMRSPHLSPGDQAAPIYVIERTDIVRIYVDIPERDADLVRIGSDARVKLWAYRDEWLPATVTRLSWSLNVQSRTMRAEIDLPNPNQQIRPGMYAYGKVRVERRDVRALPKSAFTHVGGKAFIWRYQNGHAVRTEVQTGVRDGQWIEITNRRLASQSEIEEQWVPIDRSESILFGQQLSILTEGALVRVDESSAPPEGELAADSG
jgi:HlyD family secretion protein